MKKLFFLPALAAMMFSSCSSDEPTVDNPADQGGESYMAVTIRTAGMGGSKAAPTDDQFEAPENDAESKLEAENVRFYFFTADGRPFTLLSEKVNGTVEKTNMVKPQAIKYTNNAFGNEEVAEGVLVLGKPDVPYVGLTPAKVVCVANPKNVLNFDYFANKTLAQLKNIEAIRPTNMNTFAMISSTYADGNTETYWADCSDKAMKNMNEAQKNPVHIYIERLAAKVRVDGLGTSVVQKKDGETTTDETFTITTAMTATGVATKIESKLDVQLVGWQLYQKPSTCNAIKDIASVIGKDPFADWNDALRHRSYWSVTGTPERYQTTYNIHDASQFILGNKGNATNNKDYIYENTSIQATDAGAALTVTERSTTAPAIVVKGIIKLNGQTTGYDFCRWGGQLFTSTALKQMIFNAYKQGHPATELTVADVNIKGKEGSKSNTWKAMVGNEETNFDNISYWENGETSYWLNIQHLGGKFGVVRNHIYDYTVDKVVGLGVPGNDPKNPDPETQTYLAARLYVLNWRVVSHNVTLK